MISGYTKHEWLKDGIIVVQEAEQLQQVRRGLATCESLEILENEHKTQRAESLSHLGIDLAVIDAFVSLGYDLEDEFMPMKRHLAEELHKRGIRLGAYVQTIGTIYYEGVINEEKDVLDWMQRDHMGRIPTYYSYVSRLIPCINNEDFLRYVEKGVRYAVDNLDPDLIFFDNYGYYTIYCCCDNCIREFRRYLKEKYPERSQVIKRLGLSSVDGIFPPRFPDDMNYNSTDPFLMLSDENSSINDPVMQEWIRFRCQRLGDVSARFSSYVKSISPKTAVVWNAPYMGPVGGLNNSVFHGIWPEYIYPHCDAFSAEAEQGMLGLHEDGRLCTRIRTFKMAQRAKRGVWMTNFMRKNILLDLCESMAFNPFLFNTVGPLGLEAIEDETRDHIEFFKKNRGYFKETEEISDTAILYSFASLSYDMVQPFLNLIYAEEVLIREKVPYSIIYDKDMEDMSSFKTLILPDVRYMSAMQIEQINSFVLNGGCVIATGKTSLYDEFGRRRKGVSQLSSPPEEWEYGLEKVLGIKWPMTKVLKGDLGKGRFVILPKVFAHKGNKGAGVLRHSIGPGVPYLKGLHGYVPENHQELRDAITLARAGNEILKVEASEAIAAGLFYQSHNRRFSIHLINYDTNNITDDIKVRFKIGSEPVIEEVLLISPERPEKMIIDAKRDGEFLSFAIPGFKIYSFVVIQQKRKDE